MPSLDQITTDELVAAPAAVSPAIEADSLESTEPIDGGSPLRARRPPVEVIGLIGVIAAFIGIATLLAFQQPPFYETDEKAHLGYAHAVASFRLPEVETPAAAPDTAVQWLDELGIARDARYRGVWVANHPPLNYILAAPAIWVADIGNRADGGALFLRLQNISLAAIGIAFTYLLAVELTRIRRLGLAAAAVVALIPQSTAMFSRGMNDGLAFAATTGLLWAAMRFVKRGGQRRDLYLVAGFAVASAGARTATMMIAVAVVGLLALGQLVCGEGGRWRRVRSSFGTSIIGLGPAAALFGWFYVRNMMLYGDIGGSDHVLRYFRRRPRGSILEMMEWGWMWGRMYQRMLSTAPLDWSFPRLGTGAAVVMSAGLLSLVLFRRTGDGDELGPAPIRIWWLVPGTVSFWLITVTVAQHVSGGGNQYPRYFIPVIGFLAVLAVLSLDRILPRILPVVLIVIMAAWLFTKIPVGNDPATMLRARDNGPPPRTLRTLPVGDGVRRLSAFVLIVGSAVALTCMAAGVVKPLAALRDRLPTVQSMTADRSRA